MANVEQLWVQSAHEIKNNLLDQCRVICHSANFREVGLDKIVVDIEVALNEGDETIGVPEFEHADPAADP